MSEPRRLPPEKYTCGSCVHYTPEIIYTHMGRPLPLWYGRCGLHPEKEQTEIEGCVLWEQK